MIKILSVGALAAVLAAPALAAEPDIRWNDSAPAARPAEARIPFARQGGIDNWAVTNEKTVYVQDRHRQWYRADLMSPCIGIRFAQRIGFEFEVDGSFDKFSSIRYDRQSCPLTSLTKSNPPPGHKGKVHPDLARQAELQNPETRDPS